MNEQTQPTDADLKERCAEIVEWQRTGVLHGSALRNYAGKHWAGHTDALQMAERDTSARAMELIAKWGTPAGAGEVVATVIKKGADRQWMSERLGHLPDGIYSLYLAQQPTQAQASFKSGAKSFQTYAEANAYSKGYYAGKKAATKAQAGAGPLTVDEVEQLIAQWSYEVHGDRARYLVRMTEQHHGIKGKETGNAD